MALSNYTDLVQKIIDQSHRDDLDLIIDDFIELAEVEMRANPDEPLKMNTGESISNLNASTSTRLLALPTGFQSSRDFTITIDGTIRHLAYVTPNQLHVRDGVGLPCFFTINANQFEFDILPDEAYPITVKHYTELTPLTSANPTNIVLDKYPNIYLFGCLRQAFAYADNDQQLSKYTQLFYQAIKDANRAEKELRYANNPQITVGWAP